MSAAVVAAVFPSNVSDGFSATVSRSSVPVPGPRSGDYDCHRTGLRAQTIPIVLTSTMMTGAYEGATPLSAH